MTNHYFIVFSKRSQGKEEFFRLPVNPEKMPIDFTASNGSYNVLGIGPVMVPRQPELRKISISSYFPGKPDLLTLTGDVNFPFQPPEFYTAFFSDAMIHGEVLHFIPIRGYETGQQYFIQENHGMDVLVTSFHTEERGGETGDFYYDLELTEYRDYSPSTVEFQEQRDSATGAVVAVEQPARNIPQDQIYVGAKAVVNGTCSYSSYGDGPTEERSGEECQISRIVGPIMPSKDDKIEFVRKAPIHIVDREGNSMGWTAKGNLKMKSGDMKWEPAGMKSGMDWQILH